MTAEPVIAGAQGSTRLARTLGLWAIVGLGLGYMTPTVVFDTFGIVSAETGNVVPTAYAFALVVMMFTAISYGRMTQVFPSAGSAYTYTDRPAVGVSVGGVHPVRHHLVRHRHRGAAVDHPVLSPSTDHQHGRTLSVSPEWN